MTDWKAAGLIFVFLISTTAPAIAEPSQWRVEGSPAAPPFRMSFKFAKSGIPYLFECQANAVSITETGVIELMDVNTGEKIGDGPSATMTPGAALMGLYTDEVKLTLLHATAKPNAHKGWDLTISLPTNDPAFRSMANAKVISLMTTGWTGAVGVKAQDRAVIASFVAGCGPS